jgi:hypothetical protein
MWVEVSYYKDSLATKDSLHTRVLSPAYVVFRSTNTATSYANSQIDR